MRTGRPRKHIDRELFESLCQIQCTEEEIASILKVCADTLVTWCKRTYKETFSESYKKLSANGKQSLRRYQFKMAETNPAMAIWLGKQYLGQREPKLEINVQQLDSDLERELALLAAGREATPTGEAESETVN